MLKRQSGIAREAILKELDRVGEDGLEARDLYEVVRNRVFLVTGKDYGWDAFERELYWLARRPLLADPSRG